MLATEAGKIMRDMGVDRRRRFSARKSSLVLNLISKQAGRIFEIRAQADLIQTVMLLRRAFGNSVVVSAAIFVAFVVVWHLLTAGGPAGGASVDPEYARLAGRAHFVRSRYISTKINK